MTPRAASTIALAITLQAFANCMYANADAQALGGTIQALTLQTPTGKLAGTLLVPKSTGPVPLIVIIAGSGPTDRNGNSPLIPGANNSLKLLADALGDRGIASLRYDKRGVGESAVSSTSEANMRFVNSADDAAGWVLRLRQDPRFSTITVVGHSEGSLVGMLVAHRAAAAVDGYVSIAGAGRAADKIIREQLKAQLPPDLLAYTNKAFDTLLAGHTVDSVPQPLMALLRPSVQPYLISWIKIDPAAEIARLTIPVLIAQGTFDAQVPQSDAQLLARAQPKAKLLMVDGMNHVLKRAPADQASQMKTYRDPTIPVAPELIEEIATFVKAVPRHK